MFQSGHSRWQNLTKQLTSNDEKDNITYIVSDRKVNQLLNQIDKRIFVLEDIAPDYLLICFFALTSGYRCDNKYWLS
jgi:hypothetical protein